MARDWERFTPFRVLTEEDLTRALEPVFPDCRVRATVPLGEGHRNSNYVLHLEDREEPVVLRVHSREEHVRRTELAVQRSVAGRVPVPAVLHEDDGTLEGFAYSVHEYVPGVTLERWIDAGQDEAAGRGVGLQLGRHLAALHEVRFEVAGFLGPELEVVPHDPPLGLHPYAAYMLECLSSARVRERLGQACSEELARFLGTQDALLPDLESGVRLVHGDYKPVNLMVEDRPEGPTVTGILDWEYAFAGCPLFDLGTLLRWDDELPPGLEAGMLEGYLEGGGELPENWRRTTLLMDLMNHLEFLRRGGEKVAADARNRVERTLARWESL